MAIYDFLAVIFPLFYFFYAFIIIIFLYSIFNFSTTIRNRKMRQMCEALGIFSWYKQDEEIKLPAKRKYNSKVAWQFYVSVYMFVCMQVYLYDGVYL